MRLVLLVSLFVLTSAVASDKGGVCRDHCVGRDWHYSCYPVKDPDGYTGCDCSSVEPASSRCETPPSPPGKLPYVEDADIPNGFEFGES
jgi:hypothetical protein